MLDAAKAIADAEKRTIGDFVSDLARRSLKGAAKATRTRNGFSLLPMQGPDAHVSLDIVNELRDHGP